MNRRNMLGIGAGVALAAAGVAATSKKAVAATAKTSPSVFDFGAVGDGNTDDSGAFKAALSNAASKGLMVTVPSATYAIHNPITWSSTGNIGQTWGLACQGATLVSKMYSGQDVISLTSNNTVRYFRLTGGMTIDGTGSDGNGLHIFAPGGAVWFYNATIEGLSVEGMGKNGLLFEGNVFESVIENSFFQNNLNGATFAQSKGGVVSAINVISCFLNQNNQYGLCCTNFDSQYGGTTDVRVYGGYCRDNQSYGFYYNNGTAGSTTIDQVGFENNCKSLQPGDPNGAHVYALCTMLMRSCGGYNMYGGATYLLRGWFNGVTVLDTCSQSAGGAMAATGASKLVQVNGTSSGVVVMNYCYGGLDVAGGSTCHWSAVNCQGPSPLGNLNLVGTMGV